MSISFIPNQPVFFVEDGTNPEDLPGRGSFDFSIPVKSGANDKTYFQVKVRPVAGSENVIQDPSFADPSYWSVSGSGNVITGLASIGNGSTGSVYKDLTGDITIGKNYQVQITVETIFGTAKVYDGTELLGEINSTGTHIISYTAVNDSIYVKIFDTSSYVELNNISINPLPENYAFGILDSDLNVLRVLTYVDDSEYFTLKKDTLTGVVVWDDLDLSDGCYYVAITDPETNLCTQFGLFNSDFSIGSGTSVPDLPGWEGSDPDEVLFFSDSGSSYVQITSPNGSQNYIQNTRTMLCAGKQYTIVVNASAGADGAFLKLQAGSVVTAPQTIAPSTPADYTYTITPDVNSYLKVINDNQTVPDVDPLTALVYDVTLALVNETDWSFDFWTPDTFAYKTTTETTSKILGVFNNEDGMGFCFEDSNFFPQIRVESKFLNRKYPGMRETLEDDRGGMSVAYGETRTNRMFKIEHQPNYVHDFLRLSCYADQFYIDQTQWFVVTEPYEIDFEEQLDNYAPTTLEITNPIQLVRNTNSGQSAAPPTEGELVAPEGDSITGDVIIITEPATGDYIAVK